MTSRLFSFAAPLALAAAFFTTGCAHEPTDLEGATEENQAAAVVGDDEAADDTAVEPSKPVEQAAPVRDARDADVVEDEGSYVDSDEAIEDAARNEAALDIDETDLGGKSPTSASATLYYAWHTGDRDLAASVAAESVVASLFENDGSQANWTFQGCEALPDATSCGFSYEGGGALLTVEADGATESFTVTELRFVAD